MFKVEFSHKNWAGRNLLYKNKIDSAISLLKELQINFFYYRIIHEYMSLKVANETLLNNPNKRTMHQ